MLQAIRGWWCWGDWVATLLRAQAATFWMEDLGCSRSWGSMPRLPMSMATWVWRSVPVTMLPIVWREGVKILSFQLVMSSASMGSTSMSTTWSMCLLQPSVR